MKTGSARGGPAAAAEVAPSGSSAALSLPPGTESGLGRAPSRSAAPLGAAPLDWGSAGEVGLGYRTGDANGFLLSLRGGAWVGSQRQGRAAFGAAGPIGGDYLLGSTTAWLPDEGVPWAHDLHARV